LLHGSLDLVWFGIHLAVLDLVALHNKTHDSSRTTCLICCVFQIVSCSNRTNNGRTNSMKLTDADQNADGTGVSKRTRENSIVQVFCGVTFGRTGPAWDDLSGGHRAACCVPRTATASFHFHSAVLIQTESPPPAGFQGPDQKPVASSSSAPFVHTPNACSASAIGMHLRLYCRFDG
jgi:hypothetical protein